MIRTGKKPMSSMDGTSPEMHSMLMPVAFFGIIRALTT
jgi:hypothetical protein